MWEQIAEIMKWFFVTMQELFRWFTMPFYQVLKTIWNFLTDKGFDAAEYVMGMIDFKNTFFENALDWAGLPSQVIYILNECGIDNCLLIISTALTIRLTLNIIPAAVTRV